MKLDNETPEERALGLFQSNFEIENYNKIQSRRLERLKLWKERNLLPMLKNEERLVAFGEATLKELNRLYALPFIDYRGFRYWYDHRSAKDRIDICLATTNPTQYCNGFYLYSTKDPGDGLAFVVVKTNNPNSNPYDNS